MPKQRLKLTKWENQEKRARLLRLEQLGISIATADDPSPEPDRLTLEPIQPALAMLYELLSGEVAVVVPATMTVRNSGMLITACEMTTGLDDFPLDFSDPNEWRYYQDVIDTLVPFRLKVLNDCLTGGVPLRPHQVDGVIIANGWVSVPPQCHDESVVPVQLCLRDAGSNEMCFKFEVRVDRSLKRKYERLQVERREAARSSRVGPYGAAVGQPENQKHFLSVDQQSSAKHDAKPRRPN